MLRHMFFIFTLLFFNETSIRGASMEEDDLGLGVSLQEPLLHPASKPSDNLERRGSIQEPLPIPASRSSDNLRRVPIQESLRSSTSRPNDSSERKLIADRSYSINPSASDEPVSTWLDRCVFNPINPLRPRDHQDKEALSEKIIFYLEAINGIARGSLYFVLGYKLSERVIQEAVPSPGHEILSSVYGLGVAAPMSVLGAVQSATFFKNIIIRKPEAEQEVEFPASCLSNSKKYGAKGLVTVIGMISASTITYLTYDEFTSIGWWWLVPGVPNFFVRTLMDYYSVPIVCKALYEEVETVSGRLARKAPEPREADTLFIRDKLENSRLLISSLTHPEAKGLLDEFKGTKNFLKQLDILISPENYLEQKIDKQEESYFRKVIGAIGAGVGVYGMWIYYPATVSAFDTLLSGLPLEDDTRSSLSEGLAITALTSASAITSRATYSSVVKFYDAVKGIFSGNKKDYEIQDAQMKKKRALAAATSAILAAWNASQQAEVALEFLDVRETGPKFELMAALFFQFSIAFWAVDEALLGKFLDQQNPRTPLLSKLDIIKGKLSDMPDENIATLRKLIDTAAKNKKPLK